MKHALALDPGRTTGFAKAVWNDKDCGIRYGQSELNHSELYYLLTEESPDYLICESFRFRQGKTGVDLYPVELIGVVQYWLKQDGTNTNFSVQEPWVQGDKKAFFSDRKLKEMELYIKGLEHGRSAVKHLLYWLYFGVGSQYFDKQTTIELFKD
jgi:hypothetical protein